MLGAAQGSCLLQFTRSEERAMLIIDFPSSGFSAWSWRLADIAIALSNVRNNWCVGMWERERECQREKHDEEPILRPSVKLCVCAGVRACVCVCVCVCKRACLTNNQISPSARPQASSMATKGNCFLINPRALIPLIFSRAASRTDSHTHTVTEKVQTDNYTHWEASEQTDIHHIPCVDWTETTWKEMYYWFKCFRSMNVNVLYLSWISECVCVFHGSQRWKKQSWTSIDLSFPFFCLLSQLWSVSHSLSLSVWLSPPSPSQ